MEDIRVLLVDDDAGIRKSLRMLLNRQCGIQVVGEASNGREGLCLTNALKPDVVLVDVQMPGMDGMELTRGIKQCNARTKVLVLGVYDFSRTEACHSGADAFLLKDCGWAKLVDTIHAMVADNRRLKESSEEVW
jgi:DNA-binding NarL/FixJ family response regulator